MLELLSTVLLVFTTVDTLKKDINKVKIYNQVGDVKIIRSDIPFVKITTYSRDSIKDVFDIKKKVRNGTLIIEIQPKMSCSECGTEVIVGADSLGFLDVEVTSGNVEIGTKVRHLTLSVMSGDVRLEGDFDRLRAEILSGTLEIRARTLDTLSISVSNGNIIADFQSIVRLGKISVLMGNIKIHLPKNQAVNAIFSQKQDTVRKEGDGELEVKVTSGSLNIIDDMKNR